MSQEEGNFLARHKKGQRKLGGGVLETFLEES